MRSLKKIKEKSGVSALIIALLPIVSYLILGPLEIYYGNTKDFLFSVSDFLIYYILIGIILVVIYTGLIVFVPKKMGTVINTLTFCFGVTSYVEYMFLNTKLSEDNGSPMEWQTIGTYFYINAVIWGLIFAILIVVAFLAKTYWKSIMLYSSAFLIAIQLVAVVTLLLTADNSDKTTANLQMMGDEQFEVASGKNVVVIVLDTVGTTQVDEAIVEFPNILEGLEDFTYYANADCHYYTTFPSMTHMLTGVDFDFDSESYTWMDTAWQSDSAKQFYALLEEDGYTCNIFSPDVKYVYGGCENLVEYFDNIREQDTDVATKTLLKRLTKMSIYRYLPYVLKPRFEVLTGDFEGIVTPKEGVAPTDSNTEFISNLKADGLSLSKDMKNAFIIEHLFGTHKPYTTTAEGEYVEETTINETVTGCFTGVKLYIDNLKKIGVYDDSTIIIMSDHGRWHGNDPQPIFIVKKPGERHPEMLYNTAPISHDDFQATIVEAIGKDASAFGKSIWDWNEGDSRDRTVYMRITDENYPEVQNSSFNVYYGYNYTKDKAELLATMDDGPDEILAATPWD